MQARPRSLPAAPASVPPGDVDKMSAELNHNRHKKLEARL